MNTGEGKGIEEMEKESKKKIEIIPAIIPRDKNDLAEKLGLLEGLVETVQIDFCEKGYFAEFSEKRFADIFFLEAHLMVREPQSLLASLAEVGFSRIIAHAESMSAESFAELIHEWRNAIDIGVALEITTPLSAISSFAHELRSLQLMGIAKIGAQGEPFDERVIARAREARALYPDLAIAVDGGVSFSNARALLDAGVNRLVVGSAIFNSKDPKEEIRRFKNLL